MEKLSLKEQRLLALFFLGIVFFASPFLTLFNRPTRIFGVPALFIYLFAAWAIFILLVGLIIERKRNKS